MQPTRLRVNKLSVAGIDSIGPRNGHSATRVGQSIFIYGGFHSANRRFYGDMWEIDTVALQCRQVFYTNACSAGERAFHTATYIGNNRIMILGGQRGSKPLNNSVHIFDTEKKAWMKQPRTGLSPSSRHFHSVVYDDATSRVILFGGWDSQKWLSDVFIMNLDTFSWECHKMSSFTIAPAPRCGHASIMMPIMTAPSTTQVEIPHGTKAEESTPSSHSSLFSLIPRKRPTENSPVSPLHGSAADEINTGNNWIHIENHTETKQSGKPQIQTKTGDRKRMFMFGGNLQTGYSSDSFIFDADKLAWIHAQAKSALVPVPRAGHSLNHLGGRIIVFGGHGITTRMLFRQETYFNDVYIADIFVEQDGSVGVFWHKAELLGPIPEPRAFHTMTTVGDVAYVFGGWDGSQTFCDLYSFEIDKTTKVNKAGKYEPPISLEAATGNTAQRTISPPSSQHDRPVASSPKIEESGKTAVLNRQTEGATKTLDMHMDKDTLVGQLNHEVEFLREEIIRLRYVILHQERLLSEASSESNKINHAKEVEDAASKINVSPVGEDSASPSGDGNKIMPAQSEEYETKSPDQGEASSEPPSSPSVARAQDPSALADWKDANYMQVLEIHQKALLHPQTPLSLNVDFNQVRFSQVASLFSLVSEMHQNHA